MKQYVLRQRDVEIHDVYSEEHVSQIFQRKASDNGDVSMGELKARRNI